MLVPFSTDTVNLSKYLFFTGKGGVGKTSIACATAVSLADNGKKVLLVSTDPASNLQDVFKTELFGEATSIDQVPNLFVVNVNPEEAAKEYRESVVAPYRGKLPDAVIRNMEEQLSGSCTVEIAAFNEFTHYLASKDVGEEYDTIVFDTAPTGHTLRMLQLPSAWTSFIGESTHGASCLGQLSGLEEKKDIYKSAVETLADGELTTLVLVTRPEKMPLLEANRASEELKQLGIKNQKLTINGILPREAAIDPVSKSLFKKQQDALDSIPSDLKDIDSYSIPLRSYAVSGIDSIRMMLKGDRETVQEESLLHENPFDLSELIDDLYSSGKKVIFAMGKGGVGKSTIAAAVAIGISQKGARVHLATTDPAGRIEDIVDGQTNISTSSIDEEEELRKYQEEVISKAIASGMNEEDLEYIKEDLRSPCTQEIAVFRAFAEIVEMADDRVVVIDTAPTGHTLLLLDSAQSYHREVERTQGETPESVKQLLPRLRDKNETEVIIVTLPEPTPFYEAERLEGDLQRADISVKWWVVNSSLYLAGSESPLLKAKASNEIPWINRVEEHSNSRCVVIPWLPQEMQQNELKAISR